RLDFSVGFELSVLGRHADGKVPQFHDWERRKSLLEALPCGAGQAGLLPVSIVRRFLFKMA
ncbi:MAG TPA: hypothetical protein VGH00_08210, partial [Chthoniobacterales bacterium]